MIAHVTKSFVDSVHDGHVCELYYPLQRPFLFLNKKKNMKTKQLIPETFDFILYCTYLYF